MNEVLSIIFKVTGAVLIMIAAADLLGYGASGSYANNAGAFIGNLADSVVNLPATIICYILNAVLQIIGFVLTAVFNLIPGVNIDASITPIPCSL